MYMTQSLSQIMIGYSGFFHLCMRFVVRNMHRIIQANFFYSLTAAYYGQSVNVSSGDSGGSDDGGGLSNLYRDTVTTPWQPQTPCLGTQSN